MLVLDMDDPVIVDEPIIVDDAVFPEDVLSPGHTAADGKVILALRSVGVSKLETGRGDERTYVSHIF